jgi:hypothetical protein
VERQDLEEPPVTEKCPHESQQVGSVLEHRMPGKKTGDKRKELNCGSGNALGRLCD